MLLKSVLIDQLEGELDEEEQLLQAELYDLKRDQNNQSKSSAGDKYETDREMAKQAEEKILERLTYNRQQMLQLQNLKSLPKREEITVGSLVKTKQASFFFGISKGKMNIQGSPIFMVSLNSPIGKAFQGKKAGTEVLFRNENYQIQSIH